MASLRWLLFPLLLVACPSDEKDEGDTDDTSGGAAEDSVDDAIQPVINSIDVVDCVEYQSAGEAWSISLSVDDPQGPDTVSGGSYDVLNSEGGVLASYTLTCNEGTCLGSFRADYDSITCSLVGSVTFRFVIEDEDGNQSAPTDYAT